MYYIKPSSNLNMIIIIEEPFIKTSGQFKLEFKDINATKWHSAKEKGIISAKNYKIVKFVINNPDIHSNPTLNIQRYLK
jgi:hypothetical protein